MTVCIANTKAVYISLRKRGLYAAAQSMYTVESALSITAYPVNTALELRPSAYTVREIAEGHRGVFAAVAIPRNTFAFWYTGQVRPDDGRDSGYILRIDEGLVVDAEGERSSAARLVNGSPGKAGANLAFMLDDEGLAPTPFRAPYLITIKDILAGEQLLAWYGPGFVLPHDGPRLHEA